MSSEGGERSQMPRLVIYELGLALLFAMFWFYKERASLTLFWPGEIEEWVGGTRVAFNPLWIRPTFTSGMQAYTWFVAGLAVGTRVMQARSGGALAGPDGGRPSGLPARCAALGRCLLSTVLLVELVLHGTHCALGPRRLSGDKSLLSLLSARMATPLQTNSPFGWDLHSRHRDDNPSDPADPLNQVPKQPNELRILCLGDSWTSGAGVSPGQAWPAQLQQLLEAHRSDPKARFRVYNGGRGGASWQQIYLLLTEAGLALQPDIVVFGGGHQGADLPSYEPYAPKDLPHKAYTLLTHISVLANVAASLAFDGAQSEVRVSSEEYLQRCIQVLAERNIYGVFFAHPVDIREVVHLRRYLPVGESIVLAEDSRGSFHESGHLSLAPDGRHPSEHGHALLARLVAERLLKSRMVPCTGL